MTGDTTRQVVLTIDDEVVVDVEITGDPADLEFVAESAIEQVESALDHADVDTDGLSGFRGMAE